MRLSIKGFSHGLTKCPPDTWLHQSADWCRPFESLSPSKIKRAAVAALLILVGVSGFEPEASWTRTKRDTKLRHTPLAKIL